MIPLSRLNHSPLFLNPDLVKYVESAHDTVITLTSGEKLMVLETADEIVQRIVAFRQQVLSGLGPSTLMAALAAGEMWLQRNCEEREN